MQFIKSKPIRRAELARTNRLRQKVRVEILKRPHLDSQWTKVLFLWISRFKTFTIDMFGTDIYENRLLEQSFVLLAKLPNTCDNNLLCSVLSTEFEGLFWRAERGKICWQSIEIPYVEFKRQLNGKVFDLYVSEEPQLNPQSTSAWLINELTSCQQVSTLLQ